jgi:hypothetical protein
MLQGRCREAVILEHGPKSRSPIGFPGDQSEEETPVPIPNTEVKGLCGDGTAALAVGE